MLIRDISVAHIVQRQREIAVLRDVAFDRFFQIGDQRIAKRLIAVRFGEHGKCNQHVTVMVLESGVSPALAMPGTGIMFLDGLFYCFKNGGCIDIQIAAVFQFDVGHITFLTLMISGSFPRFHFLRNPVSTNMPRRLAS